MPCDFHKNWKLDVITFDRGDLSSHLSLQLDSLHISNIIFLIINGFRNSFLVLLGGLFWTFINCYQFLSAFPCSYVVLLGVLIFLKSSYMFLTVFMYAFICFSVLLSIIIYYYVLLCIIMSYYVLLCTIIWFSVLFCILLWFCVCFSVFFRAIQCFSVLLCKFLSALMLFYQKSE